jgi:hypothetical protein
MANQTKAARSQAVLNRSLSMLLNTYLEDLQMTYLRMAEQTRVRQGVSSWTYVLFECDIARDLDLPEYRQAITKELIKFFNKPYMAVRHVQSWSKHFLITIDLEKKLGILTEQTCLKF